MYTQTEPGTPRRFAVLLYRQWEALDVMGPLECLNTLSRNVSPDTTPFSLDIITPNGDPASTAPKEGQGSLFNQQVIATHGYSYTYTKSRQAQSGGEDHVNDDLLKDIPEADFLLIPGGLGPPPGDETDGVIEFIRQYYTRYLQPHKDRYLFTVCTGAGLAARAGCLDGCYATTNKVAWDSVTEMSKGKTYWVGDARWVDQGNIWTTSGVSAGTDGMVAWMSKTYGQEIAEVVTDGMEYEFKYPGNWRDDPFGKKLGRQNVKGGGLPDPPAYPPPPPSSSSGV